jgi:hypothetical protein
MRASTRNCVALWMALVGAACAGPLVHTAGGYWHRKHDFRIAEPPGPGPSWKRVDVDGAPLAFRRAGPDAMSLLSRCGRPVAEAQLMARHLVIGVEDRTLVRAGPVRVAGRSGWTQTLETRRGDVPVLVKTVTLVVGDCTFDWILVAAGPFAPAEGAFDRWWASFRLGARYEEEREG